MIRYATILVVMLPGLACAGWKPVDASKPVSPGKAGFSVVLPEDWLYDTDSNSVSASHDGPPLNGIYIQIAPHKKVFRDSKKVSTPQTTPEDLAEDFIADVQVGPGALPDVVVVSNEPAELAGKPAFRVHLRYRAQESSGGAQIESVTLGTALESGVMLASYRAPSIHFFGRWVAVFDEAAKSITLITPPKH